MAVNNSNLSFRKNIDISDLISETFKRWYFIVAAVFVSILVSIIYTLGFVTPIYASTAKILILSKTSGDSYTTSDFSFSTYLSNDFAQIMVDTPVLKPAAESLGDKYSEDYLRGVVSVDKVENTRILTVTAKTPNPNSSKQIVDAICEASKETLVDLMQLDGVEIINQGNLPRSPLSPNLKTNIIVAVLIGFFIAELGIALNFVFNSCIASPKDIEKYLGLTVLATIPYNQTKSKAK